MHFPDICCSKLSRPAEIIKNLVKFPEKDLYPAFIEDFAAFKDFLMKKPRIKKLLGHELCGEELAIYAQHVVSTQAPVMSKALFLIVQQRIDNKILGCVQEIVKAFEMKVEPFLLDINQEDLIDKVERDIVNAVKTQLQKWLENEIQEKERIEKAMQ